MTLKKLIEKANDGYKDGLILDSFDTEKERATGGAGDGLAQFIVEELCETYDAKSTSYAQRKEAVRVLERAIAQLECVITELEP